MTRRSREALGGGGGSGVFIGWGSRAAMWGSGGFSASCPQVVRAPSVKIMLVSFTRGSYVGDDRARRHQATVPAIVGKEKLQAGEKKYRHI